MFDSESVFVRMLCYAIFGAMLLGVIGFIGGFFGPIIVALILAADAGVGPLWGFVLGPLGFIIGGIAGAIYGWKRKRR